MVILTCRTLHDWDKYQLVDGDGTTPEQPPIMDRALFEAVRQKSLAQWSHRTIARNDSDHLLTGLLFDDAGHRMGPTHATKAGVRYRYYVSTPVLHGEAKTAVGCAPDSAQPIEELLRPCGPLVLGLVDIAGETSVPGSVGRSAPAVAT
jgi:hypothetical protein